MNDYLKIFIDAEYPDFLDKYLKTKTMERLKYITQFCGCDYTKLYSPLFLYMRFDHSLVVAHMTWHFTHDKEATIVALLHDVGTPCFAHTIDYVYGDYMNQESSERKITDMLKDDDQIIKYLKENPDFINDEIDHEEFHSYLKELEGVYYFQLGTDFLEEKEYNQAKIHYEEAIKNGNPKAMYNYAIMNEYGIGVPKNNTEALEYYKMAMEQNISQSIYKCGNFYEYGKSVEKNYKEAIKYYKQASQDPYYNRTAMFKYATMLEKGKGVTANIEEAKKYYKMSMDKGNLKAKIKYHQLINNR